MAKIVDLDALIPPSITIKLKNQEIEVKPPKTENILKIGYLGQQLQAAGEMSADKIKELVDEIKVQINICIPELSGHELTSSQMLKIMTILSEMATPPENKELEEKGISAASPKA